MCLTSLFPGSGKGKNLRRKEAFNSANKWFFSPSSSSPRKKVSKSHLLRERTVCVNSEKKIFYRRLSLEADLMDLGINKIALRSSALTPKDDKNPTPISLKSNGIYFFILLSANSKVCSNTEGKHPNLDLLCIVRTSVLLVPPMCVGGWA